MSGVISVQNFKEFYRLLFAQTVGVIYYATLAIIRRVLPD